MSERWRPRIARRAVRRAIAEEAARLMYLEGVGQYLDAKRTAAKRVLGRDGTGARVRHSDLPSNGEIRDALLGIARLAEGADRSRRLFAMRAVALEVLEALGDCRCRTGRRAALAPSGDPARRAAERKPIAEDFGGPWVGPIRAALARTPARPTVASAKSRARPLPRPRRPEGPEFVEDVHARLIGSVWSGHVRAGSDIDVHVFTDDEPRLQAHLRSLGWKTRDERVSIRMGPEIRTFQHIHVLDQPFPVELSVYPLAERRVTTRSSTDGRPIDRVSAARLRARMQDEHPDAWASWQASGVLDLEERALPADAFAGLLEELAG